MRNLRAAAFLTLFVSAASAQLKLRMDKIVLKGGTPYTDAEILQVAAVQQGAPLEHLTLAVAAQNLMNTGLFNDVQADYLTDGRSTTVTFKIKPVPAERLLPPVFLNVPWFADADLEKQLEAKVPLYHGLLPEAGNQADAVATAITDLLATQSVTAQISHAYATPAPATPHGAIAFHIDEPKIVIAAVTLSEVPADLAPQLQSVAARMRGTLYDQRTVAAAELLRIPAQRAGFVAAHLEDVRTTVAAADGGYATRTAARFVTGGKYTVSVVTAQSATFCPPKTPVPVALLSPGGPAGYDAIESVRKALVLPCLELGYMDAFADPGAVYDEQAHTVAYHFTVVTGDIFHLSTLNVAGLQPADRAAFDAAWKMKVGDPYNRLYPLNFLANLDKDAALRRYSGAFQAAADPQTHDVELTLTFRPAF